MPNTFTQVSFKGRSRTVQYLLFCSMLIVLCSGSFFVIQAVPILLNPFFVIKRIPTPCILEYLIRIKARWIINPIFDILLEMPQQPLHRPCCGIPKSANGMSLNLTADLLEHGDFTL